MIIPIKRRPYIFSKHPFGWCMIFKGMYYKYLNPTDHANTALTASDIGT